MPPLPARRNSLCVFCAFAAQSLSQPQRFLPRIQVAFRSDNRKGKPKSKDAREVPFQSTLRAQFRPGSRSPEVPLSKVRDRVGKLRAELGHPEFRESLGLSEKDFDTEWLSFERTVSLWIKKAPAELQTLVQEDVRGKETLGKRLRYMFYAQACGGKFTAAELQNQKEVADLRYPAEWYPATREIQRTVHLHVGPTNSGKTYHALKRLEEADTGIYLGPLRLLAHEVYTRLNAKNKSCALVTGEEQRIPEGDLPQMFSCTIEMAPLNTRFDVAVIDEIQMINHQERGWAWTQAYLGLQAKEIHLCGEARTVPIMRELAALVGDKVHVHEYQRLTPLQVMPESLKGGLKKLEKGDCVVAFSVLGIHALRREIETKTGKHCAIVYGSLPPETRAQQARLFNDPDNDYDYLVASDAIGMGLNLAIKRVIFESTVKNNGITFAPLMTSEIKQIAGRAGRYKTAQQAITTDTQSSDPVVGLDDTPSPPPAESQTVGWVTTLDKIDHVHLKRAMDREPEPITSAGLFPPSLIIERFASYFPPGTPFSYIMLRLQEISELQPRFHLCTLKDQLAIADVIHPVKALSTQERLTLCAAPANMRDKGQSDFLRSLAECIAENRPADLLEIAHIPLGAMDAPPTGGRGYLYSLELLHKMLVMYLWLSYRFPNILVSRSLANHTKKLVEDQIEETLTKFTSVRKSREDMMKMRRKEMKKLIEAEEGEEGKRVVGSLGESMPVIEGQQQRASLAH
ncbi:P-loop containing nucleoside triphosphate hydrolase protein [Plenodomus tracheiphilus IPT5]|uniref:RNA helicase n=1 Tax=Plenodomus tracheiphilus IPT5 TaxID=1408161 RepID=A0A6A7BK26_9PLEO|nr:P-loop containing nucleoside triphosphate hydrolase protein [Plenodomus tracheiphilus IPT5]